MSPTDRDGTPLKGPQPDTRDTAESGDPDAAEPNPHEERTMDEDNRSLGIRATLARMALVRQKALSVNGAYVRAPRRAENPD